MSSGVTLRMNRALALLPRVSARLDKAARSLRLNATTWFLPASVKGMIRRDRAGPPFADPGSADVILAAGRWLCRAQDASRSADGGVARGFGLLKGWESSYPETTGYIIPTMLRCAAFTGDDEYRVRAKRMLDWLVAVQFPSGAWQGGKIDSMPVQPVAFNTGQILLGLAAGEVAFGGFQGALYRAADWLVAIQDPDGCWRRYASPFVAPGEKAYDTHIAWGLLAAATIAPDRGYAEAALSNVHWAMTHQRANGWLDMCCLTDASRPLTHTIGYALRGLLEAYRYSGDVGVLRAAQSTADGLLYAARKDGSLPGRTDASWSSAADWVCLTGLAQVACCWLMLYEETSDVRYRNAAFAANRYLRRTVALDGSEDLRGGVKGSFPVDGDYGKFEYLSWGAKFLVDSLMLEIRIRAREPQLASDAPLPNGCRTTSAEAAAERP